MPFGAPVHERRHARAALRRHSALRDLGGNRLPADPAQGPGQLIGPKTQRHF
jgi:hypothetical protein